MDSSRVKRLATGARESLRNEVSGRLDSALAEGSKERLESPSQVRMIEKDVSDHGRDEVVDRAAYTWFNRLCALRFMDANGYTPTPVVTPRPGSTQPAILADAAQGVFDPEYGFPQEARQSVAGLLSGSVSSDNAVEDAYSLLLRGVCEHYARPMGYLFAEDVASSLLMPQGLLAQGSILARIVEEIDEVACADVEVLGWLYQFYIAERKDEVFAAYKKGKKAQVADIAPATQLFTPDWIVRYMTENSLGRLWMLNNPDSELVRSMDYYIAPEVDEPHIEVSSADEIRVLDPACGSGHILVYAFDLLFRMYEEEGWPTEDIPEMILRNNLFGLEIDRRAAEIASFALEMKARERDPRFFERDIDASVHVLEPVELLPQELELVPQLSERRRLLEAMAHLDEVGSLLVFDSLDEFVLTNELKHVTHDGSIFAGSVIGKLKAMLANVQALSCGFHCVIANPPYMGSGNMNPWMNQWVKGQYPDERGDLSTCFLSQSIRMCRDKASIGMVTPSTWMFISSFSKMRERLIAEGSFLSMVQLSYHGFPDVTVPTCTFVYVREALRQGSFIRLQDFDRPQWQKEKTLQAIHDHDCGYFFTTSSSHFGKIPGTPIAYWLSPQSLEAFTSFPSLSKTARPSAGLQTGNNDQYLRLWWEVGRSEADTRSSNSDEARASHKKWYPYNKGGLFRKWYGNRDYFINWKNDGKEVRACSGSVIRNPTTYFRAGITWSALTSGSFHGRYSPPGSLYDTKGSMCFPSDDQALTFSLGFLNSSTAEKYFEALAPTIDYNPGSVGKLPDAFSATDRLTLDKVAILVHENVEISHTDWDAFETSWDFVHHPLVNSLRLMDAYAAWSVECRDRFDRLKANEEELNCIFARIYHMEGEVPIEVPDDKVSVRLADRDRDARALISYGVGCMFGRYSTEAEGLVLADQGSTLSEFRAKVSGARFLPDKDNVLPVLSDEWFDDDIVTGFRTWLAHAFSPQTVDENVAWLEESIGKNLRSYFCKDFYTDHLKTYQKRPIYWMFQSPRKSFQCLVYVHRYDEGTVGAILTGYLRPLEDKLRARLQVLESPSASAADAREANRVRGMIAELEQWEREVIYPLAHERVSIDLDDGVKVNYNKFPRALAKVSGLSDWK